MARARCVIDYGQSCAWNRNPGVAWKLTRNGTETAQK